MINVKAEAIFHSISMQKINQCQEQTKDINNTEAKQKINTHTHTQIQSSIMKMKIQIIQTWFWEK